LRRVVPIVLIPLASGFALGGFSPARAADGVVSINWDSCTGPVQRTWAGPGVYSIYVSVLGIDQPQQAYDVRVIYGDPRSQVPDAWAFEPGGCQAALDPQSVSLEYFPPAVDAANCPAFMGTSSPSGQFTSIQLAPPTDCYAPTQIRCVVAVTYHPGVTMLNTQTRYFLARFRFDHTRSVEGSGTPESTCGGAEIPVCFRLGSASYLTMDGTEIPFGRNYDNQVILVGSGYDCSSEIPARPTTWGQLKAQYR
jgi:hypothetical protein